MTRTAGSAASSMNRAADSSGRTSTILSSVDRSTRETREVPMIATMKMEAIFMPSGRSMTLTIVV